jgi:crotonobetainyl-CoA:carnitine CoA-transferase CaiB-like acyl-CoA transferase
MIRREQHPLGGEVLLSGHPVKFEAGEAEFTPAPELGQHSAAVLADFGFETGEVAELIADSVVVAADPVSREV